MRKSRVIVKWLITSFALVGISPTIRAEQPLKLCAAIQGNGHAIFGHFHSLARTISEFGLFDGAAGSSSATITMFLLESMLQNPAIKNCQCSEGEKAQRVALMLKSMVGFYELSPAGKGAEALFGFIDQTQKAGEEVFANQNQIELPTDESIEKDLEHLRSIFKNLFNPRFAELLQTSPDKNYHLQDYHQVFHNAPFQIDSEKVFLRPYPVTFLGIGTVIGWVGNFYAARGYQNQNHWQDWFRTCKPSVLKDRSWGQIAYSNYDPQKFEQFIADNQRQPTSCLQKFEVLMNDYREHDQTPNPLTDRVDEPVGKYLATIPITGLLVGDGVKKIANAKRAYWNAENDIKLGIDFKNEFRVGYFGSEQLLAKVKQNVEHAIQQNNLDEKTSKFYPLPGYTWRTVFDSSPAEPSIAEAYEIIPGQLVSVGGYADPFPATIEVMAGCEKVVYYTSERKEFKLVNDINALLGATDTAFVDSGFKRGIADSDAVWCTDWSHSEKYGAYLKPKDIYNLTESSFSVGLDSESAFFLEKELAHRPATLKYGCHLIN